MWTDPSTGDTRTQAGMQLYRAERGKLAETWLSLRTQRTTCFSIAANMLSYR